MYSSNIIRQEDSIVYILQNWRGKRLLYSIYGFIWELLLFIYILV